MQSPAASHARLSAAQCPRCWAPAATSAAACAAAFAAQNWPASRCMQGEGGAPEGLSDTILETPTYVLAVVFFVFIALSFTFELVRRWPPAAAIGRRGPSGATCLPSVALPMPTPAQTPRLPPAAAAAGGALALPWPQEARPAWAGCASATAASRDTTAASRVDLLLHLLSRFAAHLPVVGRTLPIARALSVTFGWMREGGAPTPTLCSRGCEQDCAGAQSAGVCQPAAHNVFRPARQDVRCVGGGPAAAAATAAAAGPPLLPRWIAAITYDKRWP